MIKNNKAFTLIELLVVIAILGVLVLMAAPKLLNYTQKAELATIQNDVKVMETKVSEELIPGDDLLANWDDITPEELTTLEEGGMLYESKGKVNSEIFNTDNFKAVPNEFKKEINTKLKGDFYANNNGKVYYKHVRKLNVGFPSDGKESVKNGIYTQEEIDNLISNENYIEVKTAEDLNNVRNNIAGKYIQTANIDMSDFENFEPIGNNGARLSGIYDGGGFEISNLTINKPTLDNIGLFGYTSSAIIENVGLKDVDITGRSQVGGLVGYNDNNSTVGNSYATGAVTGTGNNVGGLVGLNQTSSTVNNSYATGAVTGNAQAGGLVGNNYTNSTVEDSYATGAVTGKGNYVGGLVGYNYNKSTVSNSYATGEVDGFSNTGGLVGYNSGSTVSKSYYDTATTRQNDSGKGTGKSTEEMKRKITYNDWNFDDVWQIEEGISYPTLR